MKLYRTIMRVLSAGLQASIFMLIGYILSAEMPIAFTTTQLRVTIIVLIIISILVDACLGITGFNENEDQADDAHLPGPGRR